MKFSNLQAAREGYAEQAGRLQDIFEQAGGDSDLLAVSSLSGNLEERTERVRMLTGELEDTGRQIQHFEALAEARGLADAAYRDTHEPRPGFVPFGAGAGSGGGRPGGLARALHSAGWDLSRKPSVTVPLVDVLPSRPLAAVTVPGEELWRVRAPGAVYPLGMDRRWLWPHLQIQPVVNNESSISDFRSTVRGPAVGVIERALDETVADKADLPLTVSLVNAPLKTVALTISGIPNQVLQSIPTSQAFFQQEAEFVLQEAVDAHCMTAIAAGAPFGNAGLNFIEQIRGAISSMRANGEAPSLLVLNPTDSANLDTLQTVDGDFIFGPLRASGAASPLFGCDIVERSVAGVAPYVIDPARLGVLYMGNLSVLADPFSSLEKNTVRLRFELNLLMSVRDANAAHRVAAA